MNVHYDITEYYANGICKVRYVVTPNLGDTLGAIEIAVFIPLDQDAVAQHAAIMEAFPYITFYKRYLEKLNLVPKIAFGSFNYVFSDRWTNLAGQPMPTIELDDCACKGKGPCQCEDNG